MERVREGKYSNSFSRGGSVEGVQGMAELGFTIQGAGRKVVFIPPRAVSGKVVSIIKVSTVRFNILAFA